MMLALMVSPIPIPLRFGRIERVKDPLGERRLNAAAGIGDLEDHLPSAQFAVEIVMLHGRSVTSAIASIAFITG